MGQIKTQGNITIIDTTDIESFVVEYASNQSTTTPPAQSDSSWSTNRPAWRQGYYIWQRVRIHKSGTSVNSDDFGDAVCLTGSTGQTGAAGRSLTSMVTQYTTAANSVTITQSNMSQYTWTSNVPTYNSSTSAYWVRVTNTYSNPSSTEYIIYKDNGITDAMATAATANSIAQHAQEDADGALGQASVSIKEIYRVWYRTDSATAPAKPTTHVTQTGNDVTKTWTKNKPIDNANNRYYFYCDETITNGGISSWTEPVLDTSNLSQYEVNALGAKLKNFWWDSNGAHAASGIGGNSVTENTVSTYGYNSLMGVTGFSIGYNAAKVIDLKTTPSPASLDMYQPPSISGTTVTQGAKTVSLSGNALTFYNPSTGNAQLIIGANGTLQSGNYSRGSDSKFSSNGTKIDLVNGDIITKYFRVSQGLESGLTAGVYVHGTIEALDGTIGTDSTNYWEIGNSTDYNLNSTAKMIGHGSSYIQLGDSSTWRLATNRIHTGWYISSDSLLHFPAIDSKYWDFGVHTPTASAEKFLYIRKSKANTSASNALTNLLYDIDDSYATPQWDYIFYVTANGSLYAKNLYVLDDNGNAIQIGGTDGVYLLKTGGTITGNLEVNGTLTKGGKTVTYLTSTPTSGQILVADGTSGSIKTSGYTIATSVPSGALFTDKNVQTSQANTTKIYLAGTSTTGTTTGTLSYDSNVYLTTTAGTLHATIFEGDLSGTATKANQDGDGNVIKTTYLKLSGGQVTGPVSFGDSVSMDEATVGNLIVNDAGRFTNGLYGNLTGNADSATIAGGVADAGNGTNTTFAYSKAALTTTSDIAVWNGYELRKISPANLRTVIGVINTTGTGNYNWVSSTNDDKLITSNTMAYWNGAYNSSSHASNLEYVKLGKLGALSIKDSLSASDVGAVAKSGDTMTGALITATNKYYESNNEYGINMSNSDLVGINGIYTMDKCDSFNEGIHFYRDSTHWDSLYACDGRLYFVPNREKNTAGNSKNVIIEGDNIPESSLAWGDKFFAASYSVGDIYFNDYLRANRLAGVRASAVSVEYSTDGGSTWNTYQSEDISKRALFTSSATFYIAGSGSGTVTENSQLRITLDFSNGSIYTNLRKFMIFVSTNYSQNCKVTITASKGSSPDNYSLTICENQSIAGWSGWNVIPCNFTTYGNSSSANSQYQKIRFVFTNTGLSDTSKKGGLVIHRIYGYGGVGWSTPSNLALTGHIYSYDGSLNTTFPSNVTATSFIGNATSASKLNTAGTIQTNLGATTATTYTNGGNITAGVTGTLPIANGGTGATTAQDALWNIARSSDPGDLNNAKRMGVFKISNTTTNAPWGSTAFWGASINITDDRAEGNTGTAGSTWQFVVNTSSTNVWLRRITNTTEWTSWAKFYSTSNKPTKSDVGLGNVTNNAQVKGLSSGTTSGHLVTWGSDGYTVADSGIAKGSVTTKITLSGTDYSASSNVITITKANLQSAVQDTSLVLMTSAERSKLSSIQVSEGGTIDFSGVTASTPLTATVNQTTKAVNLTHNTSGVAEGTYRSVTVNTYGHVTAGTNPTTLSGYGITDAKIASGVITLGSNTITPLTASSTLDATKLSGTASISTTGNANTATEFSSNASVTLTGDTTGTASSKKGWSITTKTDRLSTVGDNRSVATTPTDYKNKIIFQGLKNNGTIGSPVDSNTVLYSYLIGLRGWSDNSGGKAHELAFNDAGVFTRMGSSSSTTTWDSWRKLLDSSNYTDYTVTKTGTGASGTWGIGISGNATTATKFSSNRTIELTGDVTGSVSSNGEGGWSITTTVPDITSDYPYQEVEWVESNGRQFVYLDWKPPIDTWGFAIDFISKNSVGTSDGAWSASTNVNGFGTIFGVDSSPNANDCELSSYNSGEIRIGGNGVIVSNHGGFLTNKTRQTMSLINTTFTKPDGTTMTVNRTTEMANKPYCNMTVFARYEGIRRSGTGNLLYPSTTRIYTLKFYEGSTVVVDLVGAIRRKDGMTGLYDKINKHFYPAPFMTYGNVVGNLGDKENVYDTVNKKDVQIIVNNITNTRMWRANAPDLDKLEDGQQLNVTFLYNIGNSTQTTELADWDDTSSNSNVYLKLTLADGTITDWIPCYYSNSGRLTSHYGSGDPIFLTYRENILTGATDGTGGSAIMRAFYCRQNYDTNDVNYCNREYYVYRTTITALYRYQICVTKSDGRLVPINSVNNNVTKTKTLTTESFDPFGEIYYWDATSTVSAGGNVGNGYLYRQRVCDLRYSFNCGGYNAAGAGTLTGRNPLFLVTVPQSDGLVKLHSEPLAEALPTSDDGLIYIYLGQVYADDYPYRLVLAMHHPVYWYKDGLVRPYVQRAENANTATKLSNTPNNTTTFLRGDNTWSSVLTGSLTIAKAGECGVEVTNSQATNPNQVAFIVGTSGNGGIYSRKHSKWIVYSDANGNVVLNGNANTATTASSANSATKWTSAQTVYVTLGTASTTTTLQGGSSSAQTIGVNGTLGVANGGTGTTSLTSGAALIGNGTGAIQTRSITNQTSGAVTASTNLITANSLVAHVNNKIAAASDTYVTLATDQTIIASQKTFTGAIRWGSASKYGAVHYDSALEAIVFSFS